MRHTSSPTASGRITCRSHTSHLRTSMRPPSTSTGTCPAPQYRQSAASLLRTASTTNRRSPPSSWSLQRRMQSSPCVCAVPKRHLASWRGQLGHNQPRRAHPSERRRRVDPLWVRVRYHFEQQIFCGRISLRTQEEKQECQERRLTVCGSGRGRSRRGVDDSNA